LQPAILLPGRLVGRGVRRSGGEVFNYNQHIDVAPDLEVASRHRSHHRGRNEWKACAQSLNVSAGKFDEAVLFALSFLERQPRRESHV
jgi:hypothetical protein